MNGFNKEQLKQKLVVALAEQSKLAAENDRLRHALAISEANLSPQIRGNEVLARNAQLYLHALTWLRERDRARIAKLEARKNGEWVSGYRPARTVVR